MALSGEIKPDITLNSPVGSKPAVYKWPLTYTSKGQKIDGAEEIIETIRWVAREYPEFQAAIENLLLDQRDFKSYDCIKGLCDKYNKITDYVMKMNKGTSIAPKTSSRASQGLLKHIIQQVYNYAVVEPAELNKYSPFSSETYGETSFEFMASLIDRSQFKPDEKDVFIDMGSGVGHIVLQMAATVKCKKCYGIEIADVPAGYAKLMEERFRFWMNWYGKEFTEFELFHGDFFEKQYADIIKNSSYILVNNFAFKPDVDHKLKQRFLDTADGTRILSSKPFCSLKSKVNERNLTDIGSILHVVEIQPYQKKDTVSWTPKPLPYYLHVLDGSRMERYYEKQKRKQVRTASDKNRPSKRRRVTKSADSSSSDESNDNTVYGPTTRKAWSEWCNASSQSAANRASADSVKTLSSRNNSTDTENYESAMDEDNTAARLKENDSQKKEKKTDTQTPVPKSVTTSQETSAQNKNGQNNNNAPKSCLDKKRDYAIKKGGSNLLQNAPPSALYSISKPPDTSSTTSSSAQKIPNIVIKVKPPIEAKVMTACASAPVVATRQTVETLKQEPKVNDENGKKLRVRKKPTPPADPEPKAATYARAKTDSKATTSTGATPSIGITANGLRSRRAQANGKAGTKSTTTTSTTTTNTTTTKKKPQTADKNLNLELLHAKTVESVTNCNILNSQPAPGCEDYRLVSITETPSLPKVIIKDLSMYMSAFLGQKNISKLVDSLKGELKTFANRLQQPNAKEALIRSIEMERMKNRDLRRAEDDLARQIKTLSDRIPKLTKNHCDEFGIKNSHSSIVTHLGALLKKHQDLTVYHNQLELSLQSNNRTLNPPAAHSNSSQGIHSPYRIASSSATLDLSLKQGA